MGGVCVWGGGVCGRSVCVGGVSGRSEWEGVCVGGGVSGRSVWSVWEE